MLQAGTIPAGVEVAKYYYKPHVEEITKELQDVLARGSAAAEEWSKGLDVRGNARMKVAENWERWEVKYQWWLDHHGPKRSASAAPSSGENVHQPQQNSPSHQVPSPIIHAPVPASKYSSNTFAAREGSMVQRFNNTPPIQEHTASLPSFLLPGGI